MNEQKQGKFNSPSNAIIAGIIDLFTEKKYTGKIKDDDRLDHKNVLITGANSGLGYAVALKLAERGANLYMACRSGIPEKGEKIKKITGSTTVWMLPVDLSDLNSIRAVVDQIVKKHIKFDVIICNASIVPRASRKTKQGFEEMFVVNYLAKYVLLKLLLDQKCIRLARTERSRIIFISSESHRNPIEFDWANFGKYQNYGISRTVELYGYYKLLLTTFAHELSRRLNSDNSSNISVFTLCPGPVNTRIAREAPLLFKPLLKLIFTIFFKSPRKAAAPVVYFASSHDVDNKSFDYLHMMNRKEIDTKASDKGNGIKLWEKTELLLQELQIKI